MGDTAIAKLASLRNRFSAPEPMKVSKADKLEGQFDLSIRNPGVHRALNETADVLLRATENYEPFQHIPGYDDYIAATNEFIERVCGPENSGSCKVIDPSQYDWDAPDQLRIESEIWRDRFEVSQRASLPKDETLHAHVESFLRNKEEEVAAGELSAGRVYILRLHLAHFVDWLGFDTPVAEINGKMLSDYRLQLLRKVDADEWSRTTANGRLNSVKSLIRWLWQIEVIASLPRVMDGRSKALTISKPSPKIVVFTKQEISTLLSEASARTKLYILLMLNCGLTQKDIGDLDLSEVDWETGRIIRKRSKTKNHDNVPVVSYCLWHETLRLLKQERSVAQSGKVLLNENGGSLWYDKVEGDGTYKKNDNVKSAFDRLRRKTEINKPLKSFKKTSATLIRGSKIYASLEGLFLGHAPHTMAQRHYAQEPQKLLDDAIAWLRTEYGIA